MIGCDQCPSMESQGMGTWSDTFQNMLTSWSTAGQQILLNLNQAKVMETTPGGTTIYSSQAGAVVPPGTRTTSAPPTAAEAIAGQGFSSLIIVAGVIALALILMNKDEGD